MHDIVATPEKPRGNRGERRTKNEDESFPFLPLSRLNRSRHEASREISAVVADAERDAPRKASELHSPPPVFLPGGLHFNGERLSINLPRR